MSIVCKIGGNAQQPRTQRAGWVEAFQVMVGAQKGFLGDVFGIVCVTEEKIGEAKDRLLMSQHERFPCRRFAVGCALNECGLVQLILSREAFYNIYTSG